MAAACGTSLQHYTVDEVYNLSIDENDDGDEDAPMAASAAIPPPPTLQAPDVPRQQDLHLMSADAKAKADADARRVRQKGKKGGGQSHKGSGKGKYQKGRWANQQTWPS